MNGAILIAALWGLAAAAVISLLMSLRRRYRISARLDRLGLRPPEEATRPQRLSPRRLLFVLGERLRNGMPEVWDRLDRSLARSGLQQQLTPSEVLGWKAAGLSAGLLAGLFVLSQAGLAGLVLLPLEAGAGWLGPDLWLWQRRVERENALLRDIPTLLDVLVLSLGAGMGLEQSLRVVCERLPSAASSEFRRVLADVDLGMSRSHAFHRMAARVPLEEIQTLVSSILQAEELGTSLVPVLQRSAARIRLSSRRHAEADALRAPIKMALPMVLFILPALFMVTLGPAVLQIVQQFGRTP